MRALRMFYAITPRKNIVFNTTKEQYGPAKTRPYTRISNICFVIVLEQYSSSMAHNS
jgi:hypothetical protein